MEKGKKIIEVITPEVPEEVKKLAVDLAVTAAALRALLRAHTVEGRAVVLTGLTTWLDRHKDGYKGFNVWPSDKEITETVKAIIEAREKKGEVADPEKIRQEVIREAHHRCGLYEGYESAQAVVSAFIDEVL